MSISKEKDAIGQAVAAGVGATAGAAIGITTVAAAAQQPPLPWLPQEQPLGLVPLQQLLALSQRQAEELLRQVVLAWLAGLALSLPRRQHLPLFR